MSTPYVSVVMSVYNGQPFLREAVDSVLNQTFSDFEFVIIDDGSTDGSTDLLHRYAEQDERIRLFVQENIGLTPSLNRGLRKARGTYVARIDDDDVCVPERLSLQVAYLDRHAECVAVGGQVMLIDETGQPVQNSTRSPLSDGRGQMRGLRTNHEAIEQGLLEGEWPLLQSAVTIRGKALAAVGGYDERFETNQDHDLFLKLAEVGRLANLEQTVVQYRRHRDQVTSWSSERNFASAFWLKQMRREAHLRRAMPLPRALRWPSLVGTALRRELAKTWVWPYAQKVWGMLHSAPEKGSPPDRNTAEYAID